MAEASIKSSTTEYNRGYINTKGEWVINPQFWIAMPFSDGLARVIDCNGCESTKAYSYGLHGFIDNKGNFVIPKKYPSYVSKYFYDPDFSQGFAPVWIGNGWTFIDSKQNHISNKRFQDVSAFENDYAMVKMEDKWGFIDLSGNIVIPPQFEDAQNFSEGLAAVKIGGYWGYIK